MKKVENPQGSILLVSNYASSVAYAWWLMEHFWLLLADFCQSRGQQAILAYPQITGEIKKSLTSKVTVVELKVIYETKEEKQKLANFIKENDVRVVYFTDQQFFSPFYGFLRRCGVRQIICHDHTPGDKPPVNGVKGLLKAMRNQFSYFTCDAQLAVSPLMRKRNIENGRVPMSKVYSVQNGIPLEPVTHKGVMNLRESLDIPTDDVVVITTGRAHPYKRPDFVVRAAALFFEQSPSSHVVFLIVGDGPMLEELKELKLELKLGDRLRLLGYRNDVADLLGIADIAIHAALGEGFSLSILEYMLGGLPVLVPNISSVKQAITHGENGFVFDKDSETDLARYVTHLVIDEKLRKTLGANAVDTVENHFGLDMCTEEFLRVISKILWPK